MKDESGKLYITFLHLHGDMAAAADKVCGEYTPDQDLMGIYLSKKDAFEECNSQCMSLYQSTTMGPLDMDEPGAPDPKLDWKYQGNGVFKLHHPNFTFVICRKGVQS